MGSELDPTIQDWQNANVEIGMVRFAVGVSLPPNYPLPANATILGQMEVDPICLLADGSVSVFDHEVPDRILCRAAADQQRFVAAMNELRQHFDKCVSDDTYYDDLNAAAAVRDQCTQLAGGADCLAFFTSMLGV